MKKLNGIKKLELLLALIVVMVIVMPMGLLFAENPSTSSTVAVDQGLVLGESYQRHNYDAAGRNWVWWVNATSIVYSSSADAYTWTTPEIFSSYVCRDGICACNGSAFSLWYDWVNNYVHIAYLNVSQEAASIWYARGKPMNDGTIVFNESQEAVVGIAVYNYSVPSICVNRFGYPYIAYMAEDMNTGYLESWVASSVTEVNTSHIWSPATNSTINCSTLYNASYEIMYPSVIPVSSGNVSVLYVVGSVGNYPEQNYARYNTSADLWDYNVVADVMSAPGDMPYPWVHSEVSISTINDSDDVFVVCQIDDSMAGDMLYATHRGDPGTPFDNIYFQNLSGDEWVATISNRRDLDTIVVTAINQNDYDSIWSADFDLNTMMWNSLIDRGIVTNTWEWVMSAYDDLSNDSLGFLYLEDQIMYIDSNLNFGCYGCTPIVPPAPAPTDPGTNILQLVLPLLWAMVVLVAVIIAGTKGPLEALVTAVVGIAGLITIIALVASL